MAELLSNVHERLKKHEKLHLVVGKYDYYHYLCDGVDDRGWGCGYRTLQTICSWLTYNCSNCTSNIPTIKKIQSTLVEIEDKPETFVGSRDWIGSVEDSWTAGQASKLNFNPLCITVDVGLVIDKLYDVPCKILHVKKGELGNIVKDLVEHFDMFGSPVMMGGDVDCSSKGILGICEGENEPSLLVVDPHFVGRTLTKEILQNKGYVKWQPCSDFLSASFYNLCLPQAKPNKTLVPNG